MRAAPRRPRAGSCRSRPGPRTRAASARTAPPSVGGPTTRGSRAPRPTPARPSCSSAPRWASTRAGSPLRASSGAGVPTATARRSTCPASGPWFRPGSSPRAASGTTTETSTAGACVCRCPTAGALPPTAAPARPPPPPPPPSPPSQEPTQQVAIGRPWAAPHLRLRRRRHHQMLGPAGSQGRGGRPAGLRARLRGGGGASTSQGDSFYTVKISLSGTPERSARPPPPTTN